MKTHEARAKIKEIGIVAAIRVASREDAIFAAEAVFEGGVPVVEIALTLDGATTVISQLVKDNPQLVVGAGSVLNEKVAQTCLDAGAHFITSDRLHVPLVEVAKKNGIVVFPGALTPTEVISAWEAGCDFVKVAPCAEIGGEVYIRSLRKMFPNIPLIAAGGINQQSASRYIAAGALALGIGSELIPPDAIKRRQADRIRELAHRFSNFVKSARDGTSAELRW